MNYAPEIERIVVVILNAQAKAHPHLRHPSDERSGLHSWFRDRN
jgi:hypothetical protein